MNSASPDHYRRISLFSFRFKLSLGLLILLLGIAFWYLGKVSEHDMKEYYGLMAESETSSENTKPYTARQERQGIQKDLLFRKGENYLQLRLKAEKAQLVLDHQETHTYVIEHMQKVKCWMQEELYYVLPDGREAVPQSNGKLLIRASDETDPISWVSKDMPGLKLKEIIRYIEADEAQYHYKDDHFIANLVKIVRFSRPGQELQEFNKEARLLMQGTASKVEFSLKDKDKDLNFQAHNLKAVFFDLGKMKL